MHDDVKMCRRNSEWMSMRDEHVPLDKRGANLDQMSLSSTLRGKSLS